MGATLVVPNVEDTDWRAQVLSTHLTPHQNGLTTSKFCILGGNVTAPNRGIGALTSGTIRSLVHSVGAVEVSFLDYAYADNVHHLSIEGKELTVPVIPLRFSKRFYLRNNIARLLILACLLRLIPSKALRERLARRDACLKRLLEPVIALSMAGGDSFSDIYGLARLLYVSLPQLLILALGRPLNLLPQTIGPFRTVAGRAIARFILRRAQQINTRDMGSLKEVERLLGRKPANATQVYDMGFALEPLPPPAGVQEQLQSARARGALIGLNVSGLLYQGGYTRRNQFARKSDYPGLVRRLIGTLLEDRNLRIVLVPHVFGVAGTEEADNIACEDLLKGLDAKDLERVTTVRGSLDQHEIKWVIGQCDFFIGSRMHACIAALSQCVPAVGLAYSRKFSGVLDTVGGGSRVIDLRQADAEQVLAQVNQAFTDRELLRNELKARMPAIRESVLNFFADPAFTAAPLSHAAN
jgi:colanic acid/amylovoran biosynthesis protein